MKNKKKLSLNKVKVSQLGAITGGGYPNFTKPNKEFPTMGPSCQVAGVCYSDTPTSCVYCV